MRLAQLLVELAFAGGLALVVAAPAWAPTATGPAWGPATGRATTGLRLATSEAQAVQLCGQKPTTPGQWRCTGQPAQTQGFRANADESPKEGQAIVWTWVDGGKTSNDSWLKQ